MPMRVGSALTLLLAVSVWVGTAPAHAQTKERPTATEIGVTGSEIHIAVVADVDNAAVPGLFKGAVDGVKAGAAYLNSRAGGGGLAGRKVVVDFYDSKLNPTEARNATITACQNDYALVGTTALFLSSVDDIVNCNDQAGKAVGIPDMAAFTSGIAESCSSMAFPINGVALQCATVTQNPQTYGGIQGPAKWELSQHKEGLHGPFLVSNDTQDANRGGTVLSLVNQKAGIKPDGGTTVGVSATATQSAYTPIVQRMRSDHSNYAYVTSSAGSALLLRNEAQLQGIESSKVLWECVSCYGNTIVPANAAAFEGEMQFLGFLPFDEGATNKTLANFLKYVKQVGGTPDQFSVYAWSATLAFGDAVRAAAQAHGVNGLTRTTLIDGIKSLDAFNAGGMTGTRDFAHNSGTACFVMVQFLDGKWVRQYPQKKGTFDCKASNGTTIKADLIGR
jgi:hypothetical protein